MRILFCYAVVLTIAGVTAYLLGSVAWYLLANIHPFEAPPPTEDEEDANEGEENPYDPDRQRDWDIADQMEAL